MPCLPGSNSPYATALRRAWLTGLEGLLRWDGMGGGAGTYRTGCDEVGPDIPGQVLWLVEAALSGDRYQADSLPPQGIVHLS